MKRAQDMTGDIFVGRPRIHETEGGILQPGVQVVRAPKQVWICVSLHAQL